LLVTFFLTTIAWVFFRSDTVESAFDYLVQSFTTKDFFRLPAVLDLGYLLLYFLPILLLIEWVQRDKKHALELLQEKIPKWARWILYYVLVILILGFSGNQQDFIYFQF
jgi:uncharacterized protein involved in cysteine biosynthesis